MPHFSNAQNAQLIAQEQAASAREHEARMIGAAALENMKRAQEQQRQAESMRRAAEASAQEARNMRRP